MSNQNQGWGKNVESKGWHQDLSHLDANSPWGKPVPPLTKEEIEVMNREYEEHLSNCWCDPMEKAGDWEGWDGDR